MAFMQMSGANIFSRDVFLLSFWA